jgi:uncharacterized protein YkwD
VKLRRIVSTFATTVVVAVLATAWAVASPMSQGCASATPLDQVVEMATANTSFVAKINELRLSQGLNPLIVDANLTGIADDWAKTMAQSDSIFHRTDLRSGVTGNWRRLGENVGVGPDVQQLMDAFIASPGHYKNLVDPTFTAVGVGTVRTPDGLLYTAHEFAAFEGSAPAVTPPAPRVTTPRVTTPRVTTPRVVAPRVTAPPTTVAPPTTTTTEPPVTIEHLAAKQHELQHGGKNDQQQQNNKGGGRCRSHSATKLTV